MSAVVYSRVAGVSAEFSLAQAAAPKNTLAVLGTSIEAQTSDVLAGGAPTSYNARGGLVLANAAMGWPWSSISNFGVGSDTSGPNGGNPGFTSRVPAIITGGFGYCWVGFPINDVTTGLDPDTFTIPNMLDIYRRLLEAGIVVLASTGGPTSAFATVGNGAIRNAYAKVQQAIKDFCDASSGIILIDCAQGMTNPATGLPHTSPASTVDGVHDGFHGASIKAAAIATRISPLIKSQNTGIENPFDPFNYSPNPFGLGDNASGANGTLLTTVTGTAPNAWSARVRATGAAVGSRAAARTSTWEQPSQGARLAITATASWDGAFFAFGGDDVGATGRYDQNWAASTAYTYGVRRKLATPNGYHYVVITPGTSGGSEPAWPTTEGAFVTDNTVVWMCQKTPATGDVFYAECDVETSGLTAAKGAGVRLELSMYDNTNTVRHTVVCNDLDLSGSLGLPGRILPTKMRLRTPTFTMGTGWTLRYLKGTIGGYAEAGGSFNLDVFRCSIIRQ